MAVDTYLMRIINGLCLLGLGKTKLARQLMKLHKHLYGQ